jgi:hypothetical protein
VLILRVKIKETQELSNPIGGDSKLGPKGFTLGVKTKICGNDIVPLWRQIFLVLVHQNTPYYF